MLLPFVAALPFIDDETIVKMFGHTMAIDNWLPIAPTLPEVVSYRRKPVVRTQEEQRTYWRNVQREYRKRKSEKHHD